MHNIELSDHEISIIDNLYTYLLDLRANPSETTLTDDEEALLIKIINKTKGITKMKLTKWSNTLIGKTVKCIDNLSGSGLIMGEFYLIRDRLNGTTKNSMKPQVYVNNMSGLPVGGWAYLNELELAILGVESLTEDIKVLEDSIHKLEAEIISKRDAIEFLKETGETTLDVDLLKAFRIMKKLKLGNLEDAKEVVSILNS